jgi:hypothetical protein
MNKEQILANLFPGSWPAAEPFETFKWHPGAHQKHSSQALAIDVFGTLKCSPERDAILNLIAGRLGLAESHEWEISLEWEDPQNVLHERRQSQIDAVAASAQNLIFFECKFTETDGGQCSQTTRLKQCNGNYERQINPRNQREARCVLSAKGIRYWEHIPEVFHLEADQDYRPCPFAGGWYQWMRNLVQCREVARQSGRKAGFVLVYAEAPGIAMAEKLKSTEWMKFTQSLRGTVPFQWLSYQQVVELGRGEEWQALREWVERKIEGVGKRG